MFDYNSILTHLDSVSEDVLQKISGDASDRCYFRYQPVSEISLICMKFKEWCNGFGGSADDWIEVQNFLKKNNISVPEIIKIDRKKSIIWISDLGDISLYSLLQQFNRSEAYINPSPTSVFYENAIQMILKFQYPNVSHEYLSQSKRAFDTEKLFSEIKFFITHFIQGILLTSRIIDIKEDVLEEIVDEELLPLCQWISSRPRVLCHRDYHSKNIMIKDSTLYIIDFQDIRMGPHTYDVTSLLRDSYYELPLQEEERLFLIYHSNLMSFSKIDYTSLFDEYQKVGFQRNIKALGSFGFLTIQKQKKEYLKYVEPTLKTLLKHSEYSEVFCPRFTKILHEIDKKWVVHG